MDDLDRFEELVIQALSNVDDSYYSTTYRNIDAFRGAFGHRLGEHTENDFHKYGERVFCYEFYHQLRLLIDDERNNRNAEFLNGASLQGEVAKMQIAELANFLGVEQLDAEYIPDFLMHSPGNANFHPFVMEVKANDRITWKSVRNDLVKLNQFIDRYRYARGIFILINAQPHYLNDLLHEHWHRFTALRWHRKIRIISKRGQHEQPELLN